MVSVPFYQVLRTSVPVFTVLIYRVIFSRTYETMTYMTLVPIMLGAALTTIGEYTFTDLGFLLTFAGVILAAVKTVATNRIMTGPLALPAMEVLLRMSPYAAMQSLTCAFAAGEFGGLAEMRAQGNIATWTVIALLGNGMLAFGLNVASFQTNKVAGALTISVCGNLKQCLTVLLGIIAFGVEVHLFNGAAGNSFAQQGSMDWVGLSSRSVHFTMDVLSRFMAAGVQPFTIVVGQEVARHLPLAESGQEVARHLPLAESGQRNVQDALDHLASYQSIGSVLWFGFGLRGLARTLGATAEGRSPLALVWLSDEL
ncbi:UDP-galactose transporter 1 like protein [Verticillium longisporum]|nr:UDP-galactose transporter 1 like protein [Verticillium longisporum]